MSTEAERTAVSEVLRSAVNACIVDLGAHCGEEEAWIRTACAHRATYVLVEPDPRNVQIILDRSREWLSSGIDHRYRRVIIGAVAAVMPENPRALEVFRPFHLSQNAKANDNGSGSLLTPTGHLTGMPWITFPATTLVPCYTLDYIFEREWLSKIDLLWVDIQGAEREMIQGGQRALGRTHYCFIEVEEEELYAGEALKPELIAIFGSMGWSVIGDFGCNILLRNNLFENGGPR